MQSDSTPDRPRCACGCGQPVTLHRFPSETVRFIKGHDKRVETKRCWRCERTLPRDAFEPRIRDGKVSGVRDTCRECRLAIADNNVRRESYVIDEETGCWNWAGSIARHGYGRLNVGNRKVFAHRLIYERFKGPIPDGLVLDHLCRNTRCVNPDHLEPVTSGENIRRGVGSVLSMKDAEEIRSRKGKVSRYTLANKYGVSPHTIYAIWKGKSWVQETAPTESVAASPEPGSEPQRAA